MPQSFLPVGNRRRHNVLKRPELTKGLIRWQQILQSLARVVAEKYISYGHSSSATNKHKEKKTFKKIINQSKGHSFFTCMNIVKIIYFNWTCGFIFIIKLYWIVGWSINPATSCSHWFSHLSPFVCLFLLTLSFCVYWWWEGVLTWTCEHLPVIWWGGASQRGWDEVDFTWTSHCAGQFVWSVTRSTLSDVYSSPPLCVFFLK